MNNDKINQLEEAVFHYLKDNWDSGGTHEGDYSINDTSRSLVEETFKHYGQCYLGKIYVDGFDRDKDHYELTPYTGEKVKTFEFHFVVPIPDETLCFLIAEYNINRHTLKGIEALERTDVIYNRIIFLKGHFLMWS